MTISALIIARNEENKIQRSLKSLDFVNEIIVILDRTTDKTKSMSVLYTNKIYGGSWESEGERRNYGISKCNSDWILEIDADEVVSKKLANEILEKTNHSDSYFYYIPIKNYVGELAVPYGWMSWMAPTSQVLSQRTLWMKCHGPIRLIMTRVWAPGRTKNLRQMVEIRRSTRFQTRKLRRNWRTAVLLTGADPSQDSSRQE